MAELILDGVDEQEPVFKETVKTDIGTQIEQIKSQVEVMTPEEHKTVDEYV